MKCTPPIATRQEQFNKKSLNLRALVSACLIHEKEFIDNLLGFLIKEPKTTVKALDYLLGKGAKHSQIFPSQHTIAKAIGCTARMTGFRKVHFLQDIGVIQTTRRRVKGRDLSLLYTINKALFTDYARKKIGHLLPNLLKVLSLFLLTSNYQNTHSKPFVTPISSLYTNSFRLAVDHWPLVPLLLKNNLQEMKELPPGASGTEFLSDDLFSLLQLEEKNQKKDEHEF